MAGPHDRDMKCKMGTAAVAPSSRDASPVPVAFDEAEGHQNKKQKLSDLVATTTAKDAGAGPRAEAIKQLSHANLLEGRQVWCLAKAEVGKAKRSGNAERIAEAEKAFAKAQRAMKAATAAPTYSLEEVEAAAAAATEAREAAKAAAVTTAIANEYREIQAVLEEEEKKRSLAASTIRVHKRLKKERDRIRDITPNWIKKDPVLHELHQQLRASDLEREQLVAKTKNETNKSEKMVASEMKIWLDSGAVRDVAPIKQKRRELIEKARIQKIDDQFQSDLLIYSNKMDTFTNLTVPIMRQQLVAAPAAATALTVFATHSRQGQEEDGDSEVDNNTDNDRSSVDTAASSSSSSEEEDDDNDDDDDDDSIDLVDEKEYGNVGKSSTSTSTAFDPPNMPSTTRSDRSNVDRSIATSVSMEDHDLPELQRRTSSATAVMAEEFTNAAADILIEDDHHQQREEEDIHHQERSEDEGEEDEKDDAMTTAAATEPFMFSSKLLRNDAFSSIMEIAGDMTTYFKIGTFDADYTSSAAADPGIHDPPGGGTAAVLPAADHRILCGIYRNVCKEFKVIQEAKNVAPEWGKYLHDIIPRESRTTEDKNKGVFFRKIIKLCNSYLDYLIMIGEAITGDMNTILGRQRIMKVFDYQVNREKGDMMMKILDLICTEAHVNHSLYCHVNGALQKKLLIEIVPRFIDCKPLFLKDGKPLSTLSQEEYNSEVVAHELIWKHHLYYIQAFKENCCPLPADTANLNLNIENASMEYVLKRGKDGSYKKSEKKVLVFGITWCIIVFCTGASGNSFCWNGDLVLRKLDREQFVDGLGHVFDRGPFDVNDELREVAQQEAEKGYYSVTVHFSSQFIPYIYQSAMRVATLQWAGILGSWYLLDETVDHLTGDKEKNSILHTQPASKQENGGRRPLQGLPPLVGG